MVLKKKMQCLQNPGLDSSILRFFDFTLKSILRENFPKAPRLRLNNNQNPIYFAIIFWNDLKSLSSASTIPGSILVLS